MLFTDGKIFVGDVFVGDIFSGNIPCNAPHRWEDLCRWCISMSAAPRILGISYTAGGSTSCSPGGWHWAIIRLKVSSQIHQDCVVVVGPVYLNQHKICGLRWPSLTSRKIQFAYKRICILTSKPAANCSTYMWSSNILAYSNDNNNN